MEKSVVNHLITKNHTNLKADDLPEYPSPNRITWTSTGKGHVPDVTSMKNEQFYIFEVETEDSIGDSHTADQWKLFSARAKKQLVSFIVVVPAGCRTTAEERAKELGLRNVFVWTVG